MLRTMTYNKRRNPRVGVVVPRVKQPPPILAFHIRALSRVLAASPPMQFASKAVEGDGPSTWVSAIPDGISGS